MVLFGTSLPLVRNETRAGRMFPILQCASLHDLGQNGNVCKGYGISEDEGGKKKHQMQSVKTFHFGNYGTILGVSF